MKRVYVLVFDGYVDWELGNVLAEVRRLGKAKVVSVGFTDDIVVSMGGLRVIPDMSLSRVEPGDVSLFILPGGYLWEQGYPTDELEPFLKGLEPLPPSVRPPRFWHEPGFCGGGVIPAIRLRTLRKWSQSTSNPGSMWRPLPYGTGR
ncbi:DJ-1/PfpI family protein [Desulfoluna spongiiphila]|uniref:DJ-1/PfpI family protein n=1 Tax=Desulfoluna spongiiphila TaxID=419481 RepID=UPI001258CC90|nr:DJ-1/PfpI family protein [Desulfoluna spongiiphila]VVS91450.1 dj-1/pfpi [Desulfoluna spongiiphila]